MFHACCFNKNTVRTRSSNRNSYWPRRWIHATLTVATKPTSNDYHFQSGIICDAAQDLETVSLHHFFLDCIFQINTTLLARYQHLISILKSIFASRSLKVSLAIQLQMAKWFVYNILLTKMVFNHKEIIYLHRHQSHQVTILRIICLRIMYLHLFFLNNSDPTSSWIFGQFTTNNRSTTTTIKSYLSSLNTSHNLIKLFFTLYFM